MPIVERTVSAKNLLSKSNLPTADYVINPYVGCPHACAYCYASFMKRFTGHNEPWGSFIDIKQCSAPIDMHKITGKSVFLSSVTDCYNPYEQKYRLTRRILEQLCTADCVLGISTKSDLILRDIDLLKKCRNLTVSVSLNTLDSRFQSDMDCAAPVEARLEALRTLHENGIRTVLFISPMFPGITDFRALIERSRPFVDTYWFENLNLRGSYKSAILSYIYRSYPQLSELYTEIFIHKNGQYWESLALEIDSYCTARNIDFVNYFYHEKLVKGAKIS
ncbi:radical SAM protein [Treponema brennaborense]|uniref:Radical SAM domain protein n=1 Tax=Treponema brennaborense (strain DSM 12168 / CIP 105900 / DD5/3) TaxID=906968 RepID=F4LKV9_TREBD|nr:radical SAM protein [Treponema brennaborense]AEE16556.1 Radical SAM domain protein [Treponema brennaborense DSM 12168]